MLKLGDINRLLSYITLSAGSSVGSCAEKHHRVSVPQSLSFFLTKSLFRREGKSLSQGFQASMSHLQSYPYFHTSHKVPDILIAGTIHQVPFVAEREILACEQTVGVEYCTVKTQKKK